MYTSQAGNHGPFAIRYPRGKGGNPDWRAPMREIPVGKGEKLTDGNDVVVLTLGPMASKAAAAIARAEKGGHTCRTLRHDIP